MSNLRFKVLQEAFAKKAVAVQPPAGMVSDYYGNHVFGRKQMSRYLSSETFRAFCNVLDNGAPFNREIANNVAVGMKNWALDMGATHYTHWFQPLTEGTAEKHDAFIEYAGQPQSCRMTGTIGEDKASMALERNGSEVTGVVTRCDICEPIDVEGSWQGDHIKVHGVSLAGSYIEYELTVKGNAVQGTETLSAEGEVEKQEVTMTVE